MDKRKNVRNLLLEFLVPLFMGVVVHILDGGDAKWANSLIAIAFTWIVVRRIYFEQLYLGQSESEQKVGRVLRGLKKRSDEIDPLVLLSGSARETLNAVQSIEKSGDTIEREYGETLTGMLRVLADGEIRLSQSNKEQIFRFKSKIVEGMRAGELFRSTVVVENIDNALHASMSEFNDYIDELKAFAARSQQSAGQTTTPAVRRLFVFVDSAFAQTKNLDRFTALWADLTQGGVSVRWIKKSDLDRVDQNPLPDWSIYGDRRASQVTDSDSLGFIKKSQHPEKIEAMIGRFDSYWAKASLPPND